MSYTQKSSLVKAGWKVALQYKFDFLVALITTPISLFIYYFLWKAIFAYTGSSVIRGYTFQGLVDYFVLSMIVGFFAWSDVDNWMEYDIRSGNFVAQFLRPIQIIQDSFFFEIGLKTIKIIFSAAPILLLAFLFLGTKLEGGLFTALAIVSIALASILYFMISYLIGLTAFWFKKIHGIRRFKRAILLLLSGGMIPLTFFPAWYQKISLFMPFEHVRYTAINLYQKKYVLDFGMNNAFVVLGIQVGWILLMYFIVKLVEKKAFKKFTGAGA